MDAAEVLRTSEGARAAVAQAHLRRVLAAALIRAHETYRPAPPDTLRELAGTATVSLLIDLLADEDWRVQAEAARALGPLGDRRAVDPLIQVLGAGPGLVAWAAAQSLGELGDRRAVGPLIATLRTWSLVQRDRAATALGALGDPAAIPALEPLVRRGSRAAGAALRRLGAAGVRARFLAELADPRPARRQGAATALGTLGDPEAGPGLLTAVADPVAGVRGAVVWALGQLEDRQALDALHTALADSDVRVRHYATGALRRLAAARSVEPLAEALRRGVGGAGLALAAIGAPAAPVLHHLVTDTNPQVRWVAGCALRHLVEQAGPPPPG